MSKKQVFLFQWDYMINCNENENGNGKIDHINEKDMNRPRRRHREINMQNVTCLGKPMPLCNKQHLSNI